jgi:hypothetical protein
LKEKTYLDQNAIKKQQQLVFAEQQLGRPSKMRHRCWFHWNGQEQHHRESHRIAGKSISSKKFSLKKIVQKCENVKN